MREVTVLIRHHGEPESDVSASHPRVTLRSVSSMTGRTNSLKRIVELTGPGDAIDGYLGDLEREETLLEVESLSPIDNPPVYVALTFDATNWDSISQKLTDMGVHFRSGTTITAGWERWTLFLDDSDDLREIIDSIEGAGNETDIVRDTSVEQIDQSSQLELSQVLDDLTPRQQEVLSVAIDLGYYQPKRQASIEEISDVIGIAETTTWEHMVRAESKLMNELSSHFPRKHPSATRE